MSDVSRRFAAIHSLVAGRTGTILSPQQRDRIDTALLARTPVLTDTELVSHLTSPAGALELDALLAVVSVHKTDLFRDEVQLTAFYKDILLPMVAERRRPLQVWSAGCATGEEVATLLVLLQEAGADPGSEVLGSDIAKPVLERARRLSFHPDVMRRVSKERQERFFTYEDGEYKLRRQLAQKARYECHNLMDEPYPTPWAGGQFDVIFCRNVLIYFSEAAFDRTVTLLTQRLAPGGILVLSAAEPILRPLPNIEILRYGQAFFYTRAIESQPRGFSLMPVPTPPRGYTRMTPHAVPLGASATSPSSGSLKRITSTSIPVTNATPPPTRTPPPMTAVSAGTGTTSSTSIPNTVARLAKPPVLAGAIISPAERDLSLDDPLEEAKVRFQRALDWAGAGKDVTELEVGLRQCLYLDPLLAQARYLLAVMLEERDSLREALVEYRRALAILEEGRGRAVPFFLNPERLRSACFQSVKRLGGN